MRTALTHVAAPTRARLRFSRELFWELFRYGRHIWGTAVLVFLVTQIDDAVVGRVLDLDRLSLYALAYMLANLPITSIVGVATQVAFPTWSQVVRAGDVATRDRMFLDTVRFTGALSIALSMALLTSGADLLETAFGAKWRDADAALQVLVWFGLIRGVSSNFGTLFNSLGRPGLVLREIAVKVVIILALLYPMTVAWGIRGAALAVTLPMVFITPVAAHIYLRIAGIPTRAAAATLVWPALGAALVIGAREGLGESAWLAALPVPARAVGWLVVATLGVLGLTWLGDARFRDALRSKSRVTGGA
jgi:O-antigen/teichoic acid export membrane protein